MKSNGIDTRYSYIKLYDVCDVLYRYYYTWGSVSAQRRLQTHTHVFFRVRVSQRHQHGHQLFPWNHLRLLLQDLHSSWQGEMVRGLLPQFIQIQCWVLSYDAFAKICLTDAWSKMECLFAFIWTLLFIGIFIRVWRKWIVRWEIIFLVKCCQKFLKGKFSPKLFHVRDAQDVTSY